MENNKRIIKKHKIFIFKDINYTEISEIETVEGENPKKHLIYHRIGDTSINKLIPYIEKYNDIFEIDSKDIYNHSENLTDILSNLKEIIKIKIKH